jgi:cytochrome c biogenesis protein
VVTSVFPALEDPEVTLEIYRGDLGLDDGRGQSIFQLDQAKIDSGQLVRAGRANLVPGAQTRLDDGTTIRFDGVQEWVNLQVSHDPGELAELASAVLLLAGLGLSLAIRRRRFWARVTPLGDGRTRVELGGLARSDRAGYGEEFERLAAAVLTGRDRPAVGPGQEAR